MGAAMNCRELRGDCPPPRPPALRRYGVLVPPGVGCSGELLHDVCPGMGPFLRLGCGRLRSGWWHRGRSGVYPSLSSSAPPGLPSPVQLGAAALASPAWAPSLSRGGEGGYGNSINCCHDSLELSSLPVPYPP